MSNIQDDDKLLVNRGSTSHSVSVSNFMTNVIDTDFLLVNRGADSYKTTAEDFKEYLNPTLPLPAGASDVITDADGVAANPQVVTLQSDTNTGTLFGNNVKMVTVSGDDISDASYVPVTNTITNVDATNPDAIALTFADPSPDLKFFQPGDVVQGAGPAPTTVTYKYWVYDINDATTLGWNDLTEERADIPLGTAPPASGLTYVKVHMVKLDKPGRIAYYNTGLDAYFMMYRSDTGDAGSWIRCAPCGTLGNSHLPVESDSDSMYYLIYRSTSSGTCQTGTTINMSVDGYYATASQIPQITVVNRDPVARTMVVDGGSWVGSDGSIADHGDFLGWNTDEVWSTQASISSNHPFNYGPERVFDGDLDTYCLSGTNGYFIIDFEAGGWSFPTNSSVAAYINNPGANVADGGVYYEIDTGSGYGPRIFVDREDGFQPLGVYSNIKRIKQTGMGPFGANIGSIAINGYVLADTGKAVDTERPTAESIVTGPAKSGTGLLNTRNSAVVNIVGSNGQWIDNTNSNSGADHSGASAKEFHLGLSGGFNKQRIELLALARATDWQSEIGYNKYSFVKYNGRYWYAISSTYDNPPDQNDPLDWYDLGTIV